MAVTVARVLYFDYFAVGLSKWSGSIPLYQSSSYHSVIRVDDAYRSLKAQRNAGGVITLQ